ncbi:YihY/virulence factor BrkB family protein [Roseinatronobacter monicus]|uniref:YihY/virulence factor BrkB family protein n=1 Tax=Roseinatronobacter monicus TaxID=393481 RepID=UPI003F67842E
MPKFRASFRFVMDMYKAMNARNIGLLSAGVAFFALLAVFPGIAALVSVFGVFADPLMIQDQLALLQDLVPPAAFTLMSNQITRIVWASEGVLGWTSAISILVALFLARRGVDAMLIGLCAIHGTPRRSGVSHALRVAVITLGMLIVGVVALLSILVLPVLFAFFPIIGVQALLIEVTRWFVSLGLVALWIWVFYRIGPNRSDNSTAVLNPGLVAAMGLWVSVSAGFSYYLSNFGNYNEIYGSIGAVVALLMWFYISAYAVLLGAVLNATLEMRNAEAENSDPEEQDIFTPKLDETDPSETG